MTRTLDITHLRCPMTWVRTKLELERMAPGEELEVVCPAGEALENVPRSAREAGHAVSVTGTTVTIVRATAETGAQRERQWSPATAETGAQRERQWSPATAASTPGEIDGSRP